jgi:hypothetical protein
LATLIKFILAAVIIWFMWSSLSANGDFHLGMGEFGYKINGFFKSMEQKGRELISRFNPQAVSGGDGGSGGGNDDDSERNTRDRHRRRRHILYQFRHLPPIATIKNLDLSMMIRNTHF